MSWTMLRCYFTIYVPPYAEVQFPRLSISEPFPSPHATIAYFLRGLSVDTYNLVPRHVQLIQLTLR